MCVLKVLFCYTEEIQEHVEYKESNSPELDPDGMLFTDNTQLRMHVVQT